MPLTLKMIEEMYRDMWNDSNFKPLVLVMSWREFRSRYGEKGEKLSSDYTVYDVEGCAQIERNPD